MCPYTQSKQNCWRRVPQVAKRRSTGRAIKQPQPHDLLSAIETHGIFARAPGKRSFMARYQALELRRTDSRDQSRFAAKDKAVFVTDLQKRLTIVATIVSDCRARCALTSGDGDSCL